MARLVAVNSAMLPRGYEEQGQFIDVTETKEGVFREAIQKIIAILKTNELLVSKEIYNFYIEMNDDFLKVNQDFEVFIEFEA